MSVPVHLVHKLLAAHCETRGRDRFIFVFGVKGQVSDHYSPAITTKTVSEDTGHHAVAVRHVLAAALLTFVESYDHLFKVAQ
jgi:Zn-dependent membrane protease YugP